MRERSLQSGYERESQYQGDEGRESGYREPADYSQEGRSSQQGWYGRPDGGGSRGSGYGDGGSRQGWQPSGHLSGYGSSYGQGFPSQSQYDPRRMGREYAGSESDEYRSYGRPEYRSSNYGPASGRGGYGLGSGYPGYGPGQRDFSEYGGGYPSGYGGPETWFGPGYAPASQFGYAGTSSQGAYGNYGMGPYGQQPYSSYGSSCGGGSYGQGGYGGVRQGSGGYGGVGYGAGGVDYGYTGRSGRDEGYGSSGYGGSGYGGGYEQGGFGGARAGAYGSRGTFGQSEQRRGRHYGRGPQGYQRSDDRIKEDLSDRLYERPDVDASNITIQVSSGEVTLQGSIDDRQVKYLVEDIAESISGVKDVQNQLRVSRSDERGFQQTSQTESNERRQSGQSGRASRTYASAK